MAVPEKAAINTVDEANNSIENISLEEKISLDENVSSCTRKPRRSKLKKKQLCNKETANQSSDESSDHECNA